MFDDAPIGSFVAAGTACVFAFRTDSLARQNFKVTREDERVFEFLGRRFAQSYEECVSCEH